MTGNAVGTLTSWDPVQFKNTVTVGGDEFHNAWVLDGLASLPLKAGDKVALLRYADTYVILGRVIRP